MMSQRLACPPAPGPLEDYARTFDPLFGTRAQRRGFREYLQGLLLPPRPQPIIVPVLSPSGPIAMHDASAYWRQRGTQTVDLDIDQLVDSQYAEYAVRVLGPYHP